MSVALSLPFEEKRDIAIMFEFFYMNDDLLITTLITSFATLLAVFVSHVLAEYRDFTHLKKGVIFEIEYNFNVLGLMSSIIKNDKESIPSDTEEGVKKKTEALDALIERLRISNFESFKNKGYLLKLDDGLKDDLIQLYWNFEAINRQTNTYALYDMEMRKSSPYHDLAIKLTSSVRNDIKQMEIYRRLKDSSFSLLK